MSTTSLDSKTEEPQESNTAVYEEVQRAAAAMDKPFALPTVHPAMPQRAESDFVAKKHSGPNYILPNRMGMRGFGGADVKNSGASDLKSDTQEILQAKGAVYNEKKIGEAPLNKPIIDEDAVPSFFGRGGIGNVPKAAFDFQSSFNPGTGRKSPEFLPLPHFGDSIWHKNAAQNTDELADQLQDKRDHTDLASGHPDAANMDHLRKTLKPRGPSMKGSFHPEPGPVPRSRAIPAYSIADGMRGGTRIKNYHAPMVEDEIEPYTGRAGTPPKVGVTVEPVQRSQNPIDLHAQQIAEDGQGEALSANKKMDELQEKAEALKFGMKTTYSPSSYPKRTQLIAESGIPVPPFARYYGVANDRPHVVTDDTGTIDFPTRPRHERDAPSFGSMITEVPGYRALPSRELKEQAPPLPELHRPLGGFGPIAPPNKITTAVSGLRREFDMKLSELEQRMKYEEWENASEHDAEVSALEKRLKDTEELKDNFRDLAMVMKAAYEKSEEEKGKLQKKNEELEKMAARTTA